jgi:hypothetical protein
MTYLDEDDIHAKLTEKSDDIPLFQVDSLSEYCELRRLWKTEPIHAKIPM